MGTKFGNARLPSLKEKYYGENTPAKVKNVVKKVKKLGKSKGRK